MVVAEFQPEFHPEFQRVLLKCGTLTAKLLGDALLRLRMIRAKLLGDALC